MKFKLGDHGILAVHSHPACWILTTNDRGRCLLHIRRQDGHNAQLGTTLLPRNQPHTEEILRMSAKEILDELKPMGSDSYKRTLFRHGIEEPCFGVKISDMKPIVKRIKKNYQLALDLYDSGVYDAMYLAGLIADDAKMTQKDLKHWLSKAYCRPLCAWPLAWVAAESPHGWTLGQEWIDSKKPLTAVAGWATLGSLVSILPDEKLDLPTLKKLIPRIQKSIHSETDFARYHMNSFLISLGCYVEPLTESVLKAADKIGTVRADLRDNDCQVPGIADSIAKVAQRGSIGKKRKTAKC